MNKEHVNSVTILDYVIVMCEELIRLKNMFMEIFISRLFKEKEKNQILIKEGEYWGRFLEKKGEIITIISNIGYIAHIIDTTMKEKYPGKRLYTFPQIEMDLPEYYDLSAKIQDQNTDRVIDAFLEIMARGYFFTRQSQYTDYDEYEAPYDEILERENNFFHFGEFEKYSLIGFKNSKRII